MVSKQIVIIFLASVVAVVLAGDLKAAATGHYGHGLGYYGHGLGHHGLYGHHGYHYGPFSYGYFNPSGISHVNVATKGHGLEFYNYGFKAGGYGHGHFGKHFG